MTSRFRNPGDYYREVERIKLDLDKMRHKVYIEHIGLETAEIIALMAYQTDPLVLADWQMLSIVEDLSSCRKKAGLILTGFPR